MDFTPKQQKNIDKVLQFLKPYDTLDYDEYVVQILHKEDVIEYSLCSKDSCEKAAKKAIRAKNMKYARLTTEEYSNNSDHGSFGMCSQCGTFLNKYLCYYESELDHLISACENIEDIKKDYNAFMIVGLLDSTSWLCDSLNSAEAKEALIKWVALLCRWIDKVTNNN